MNRVRWGGVGVVMLAGAVAWHGLLPRERVTLSVPPELTAPVSGVMHVHTNRSDGTGTVAEVAMAAARAGVRFLVVTDHGDATRTPDVPTYYGGVLVIDAVEVSTEGGHVVALGLPPSPYPLGGEARDVVADIARMGGMSIAAHPDSRKGELHWRDWELPVDGVEWLNGDSQWRDEPWPVLARALLSYPFRPVETLAALLDRPEDTLREWDALTMVRPVVALAASDAHSPFEALFRAFSVVLDGVTLDGDAVEDASRVVDAIRHGHVYSTVSGMAGPARLSFFAEQGGERAAAGDRLAAGKGPVRFVVESNAANDARTTLRRSGEVVAQAAGPMLEYVTEPRPGAYRVEIELAGAPGHPPVPWIVSNPVYVDGRAGAPPLPGPVPANFQSFYADGPDEGWHVESSQRSRGVLDVVSTIAGGTQLLLRYGLGGARSDSPYVALVSPASPPLDGYDRIRFTGRAVGPMRLSVQVRAPIGPAGMRWHRSVYLDDTARTVTVMFSDMRPSGEASPRPVLADVRDVLFVVDTVNASPGASGQLWIDDIEFGRPSAQ